MSTGRRQYKNLQIHGSITVEPVDVSNPWQTATEERYVVLLVGPTGAGKSNFVEILSGGNLTGISRNQLKGVTQTVQLYRMLNCKRCHKTVYLVDTPGLCDNDLSEMRVFRMISGWMKEANLSGFDSLLYFDSMTATRLSASRFNGMVMVQKALLRHVSGQTVPEFHPTLIHVTTMWNTILDTQLERPRRQFEELRSSSGPWKDFATAHNPTPRFARFRNTQRSAMKVLDGIGLYPYHAASDMPSASKSIRYFPVSIPVVMNVFRPKPDTAFGEHTRANLIARIAAAKQQLAKISEDLESAEEDQNLELIKTLQLQRDDLMTKLATFKQDDDEFTSTPVRQSRRRHSTPHLGRQITRTTAQQTRFLDPPSLVVHLPEPPLVDFRQRVSLTAEPLPSPVRRHLPSAEEPKTPISRPPSSYSTTPRRGTDSIESSSPIERFYDAVESFVQSVALPALILHISRSHRSSVHTPSDSSFEASDHLSPTSPERSATIIHRNPRDSPFQSLTPLVPPHVDSTGPFTTALKGRSFDEWPQSLHPMTQKSWKNKLVGNFLRLITPKLHQ
ncbi:hypothetical protein BJ165DRAFT_1533511 [Panaeolus papilionaceus]|nr:hypothetical protein BJ165DRAFT_1533511 [Panaeolus papilionaceus]